MEESIWNDWRASRIYFLTHWAKNPTKEARKIADGEMKLLRAAPPVKPRSQIANPLTGTWTKREDKTGKFIDVKTGQKPFKGVRKAVGR